MSRERSTYADVLAEVVASFVGSVACIYTGQPFDTVKVKLQTATAGQFSGNVDCIRSVWRNEGLTKLWAGSVPALLGAVSENAAAFTLNGMLKKASGDMDTADKPWWEPFATGSVTGFFTAFVLCPSDIIKSRAQLSYAKNLPADTMSVIHRTLNAEGVRGLYAGMGAQILRDVPFYATFFGIYDTFVYLLQRQCPSMSEPVVYATAGGFAGQIAWVSSIVPDTVKSIIQTVDPSQRKKFWPTLLDIVKTRGVYRGLFAGVEVAVIRAYPANAALFVGYEYTKKGIHNLLD